eukprot:TRINITY_DN17887_c0_g1_i3.p1 TRINITY_DN17887_c0_g1~~TRINITY_DN17887_c0_g1_i3.p1  ORF type:complete len:250 (-),score=58.38 TRINITY_DN17887_c0_g1_i3:36-785(-)
MTTAMRGSLAVLFWSFVLLMVLQVMIAFFLNLVLESRMTDPSLDSEERQLIFEYFGTCSRGILTMFELTLGNWPTPARVLQEHASEWYCVFSIVHKVTIGFAVIGVINGVFMQETFKVASTDDKIMMRQKERERSLHIKKMSMLFKHADTSGDGVLDIDEFREVIELPSVQTWLAAMELGIKDHTSEKLFRLIDDGDEELTAEELVRGVDKLKGPARSIDLRFLMKNQEVTAQEVRALKTMMEKHFGKT